MRDQYQLLVEHSQDSFASDYEVTAYFPSSNKGIRRRIFKLYTYGSEINVDSNLFHW